VKATIARQLAISRSQRWTTNIARAVDETALRTLIDGITDARDRAILVMSVYSGVCLSELQQLNIDSIQIRDRQMLSGAVVTLGEGQVIGKGNKRRRFLIALEALTALAAYMQVRPQVSDPGLFLSERRARLSCRAIQHLIDSWSRKVGSGPYPRARTPAPSVITWSMLACMPPLVMRELMGQSSLTPTERY
jgi:site-specific recombinase XerC